MEYRKEEVCAVEDRLPSIDLTQRREHKGANLFCFCEYFSSSVKEIAGTGFCMHIRTEKPRTKMLIARALRIVEVTWKVSSAYSIPGAGIEDAKGLN